MKIDTIAEMWKIDSQIDKTEISEESLKIPSLHNKYYTVYMSERMILRNLEYELKKLKLEKYEFFSQGPNEETQSKGWKMPVSGMVLKSDIPMYIDADTDIINHCIKIGIQQEKVEFLDSIIKSLNNRGYLLNTALGFIKFTNGM